MPKPKPEERPDARMLLNELNKMDGQNPICDAFVKHLVKELNLGKKNGKYYFK